MENPGKSADKNREYMSPPKDITMNDIIGLIMDITSEVHALKAFFQYEGKKLSRGMAEEWMDGNQVMTLMKISKRTFQNLRDQNILPYSRVNGKYYYKAKDLEKMLESNYKKVNREKM